MNYLSKLDSQRFGFKIAKVNDVDYLTNIENIRKMKANEVKLVISRVQTEKIEDINTLENLGFELKDSQSTYKFDYSRSSINYKYFNNKILVREAVDSDVDKLVKISEKSFVGYGHYFNDNKLGRTECLEIYKDWMKRSVLDREVANKVLVAEYKDKLAGMLSFNFFNKEGLSFAAGGMGAVSSEFRGFNIFSTLVIKGLEMGEDLNLNWEEHNVLTTNYPVNRVFSKLSFSIVDSFMTFHKWLS
ncbi:MAG: GNAT family N-acetyltransferase [Cyclobacteriaceae bacterium]|nr:GNAT family N-acetyltransferase [Cyclobacteriaceae bacterium]